MDPNIVECLDFFKFLDKKIPTAYEIYKEANNAYLDGDLELSNKLTRLNWILHASMINGRTRIGVGTSFSIMVVIHKNSKIGQRCKIGSNVQIAGDGSGVPTIGNDVYIATGAKIIGKVTIGDGAIIGANSVVKNDVDSFVVAAGVPVKTVNHVTRENFKKYSGFYYCKNKPKLEENFLDKYFPIKGNL